MKQSHQHRQANSSQTNPTVWLTEIYNQGQEEKFEKVGRQMWYLGGGGGLHFRTNCLVSSGGGSNIEIPPTIQTLMWGTSPPERVNFSLAKHHVLEYLMI